MSTINIESGGKSIPIAKVGIIDSQEKILLGSLERDLVLQTLGNISIQAGNMFYKLSFDSSGNISTSNNNMVELQSLDNFSISSYDNGTFIFDLSTESLYLVYSKDLIPIAGASASDHIYLSFINEQTLTGEQKQRLVLNSGCYIKSLNDVAYFSRADVYENQIIFVEDEKQHYILTDINNPNGKSAWTTFYIGMNGGIIYNGLTIQNTNRENLLYLNGVDNFIPGRFNGLKIGNSEKSVKLSVNTKNQTVIDSNTESLIIKTAKADILYYHDGNLGIYGEPATSDKYKIAINGTTKFNDSVFLERRLTSTDFITTNITHWDGGQGFGLIKTVNNKWFFECDDMVVRGSLVANKLKLKELEVERAYATGGHMLITDGADVDAVYYRLPTAEELETANVANNGNYGTLDANTYYYFITFKDSTEKDDSNAYVALDTTPNATTSTSGEGSSIEEDTLDAENYCPFINGDVLLCQTASGKSAKKYYCLVTYSTNKYAVVKANDFRNNNIYQYNELGEIVNVDTRFLVESGDTLIRVTNILYKNGVYEYKNRRRFIDIDGTRNQITMYDNLGDPNLFAGTPTEFNTYDDINIITGIGPNGALRLRMGELSDLNIPGLTGYGLYGDNVYLKGRLIVKTDDYEEIVGANRGSWVFGNLNKYYINDLVTYNGSVYRCIVEHQNTISSSSIPGVSDFWEIWVQKGTDGTPGSNFSYVYIVGDQVFIYNSGSGTYDKTVIPLTCTAFNVDYDSLINIKFEWVISGAVIYSHTYLKSEVTAGSISDSKNIYVTGINEGVDWSSLWNGDSSLTVSCRVYINDSTDYNSDVFSVYKVQNGADGAAGQDAFTVILSNEAMNVPATPSGAFPSNIFSDYDYSSNVIVYRGSTKLNYAATSGYSYTVSLLTGSRFSTTISTSGTECKIRINNITQDLSGGLYIPDYMVANFYVSILYNNVATGTAFTKTIAVSKAKQGPLLDWIKEWDSNSTLVGSQYVISPKIFAGTNNGGSPTGVIVGRNAFNLTEIGVAGYYHGNNTFYLSALDGSFKFGQGNSSIVYNPSANTVTFGSNVSLNWTNYTDTTVNAVKIGGRNLLLNSETIVTPIYTFDYDNYAYYGDRTCYLEAGVQYIVSGICPSGLTWTSQHGNVGSTNAVLWLRGDNGNHYIISSFSTGTTGSTFTVPTSQIYTLRTNVYKPGQYTFSKIQIEKGNKATDWTPAPEDVQGDIHIVADAAASARQAANNAQGAANTANSLLADLSNDNKLTAVEKQQTKTEWDVIASEYSKITNQASTYGVSYSSYTTAYNSLSSYITTLLSNLTTTSEIVGTTFRSNFKSYYDARTDLLNVIAIKAKTLANDAQTSANNAQSSANTAQTAANTAQGTANTAKTNAATAQSAADAAQRAANAAQTSANTANSLLSDMSNDGKLTSVEKQQVKLEWDGINSEYQKNVNQAVTFGQDYTAYYNAYNGLNGYLSPLLSNLASTSDINGTTFRSYFSSYYAARTDLLNAISIAAKSQAISTASDDATTKSNTAYTNAKNYVDTNYVGNTTYSNGIAGAINKADDARETALAMAFGRMVYRDPMFINGLNGLSLYNNSGGSAVTLTRIGSLSGCPNPYGYAVQIYYNGGSVSPGLGGFTFQTQSRAGAIFVTRFIAKIPVGYSLSFASNAIGAGGSTKWLSNSVGTGVWTEYAYKVTCGSSGNFSSTNFFHLNGSGAVTWYLAYATVFDITAGEKYTTTIDENGIYTGTLTALQVNAVAINANSITAGTLNVDRIKANSLTATHIKTDTITTLGNVTAGSFNLGNGKFIVDANGNLTSTSGKIGGWTINGNSLKVSSLIGATIQVEVSGTQFLRINESDSSMLYIRNDGEGKDCINLSTYGTSTALYIIANGTTGQRYAIDSYGPHRFTARPSTGELIDLVGNVRIGGLSLGVVTTSSSMTLTNDHSIIISTSSSDINFTLPANPTVGKTYFIRKNGNGRIWINGTYIVNDGDFRSERTTRVQLNRGGLGILIYNGFYWTYNNMNG